MNDKTCCQYSNKIVYFYEKLHSKMNNSAEVGSRTVFGSRLKRKLEDEKSGHLPKRFKKSGKENLPPVANLNNNNFDSSLFGTVRLVKPLPKIYSGRGCASAVIPTLQELCIDLLKRNVHLIVEKNLKKLHASCSPLLKSIIQEATPDQLVKLEECNTFLSGTTDLFWKQHCQKQFPNKRRRKTETWREVYFRPNDDDKYLKDLVTNIDKNNIDTRNRTKFLNSHDITKLKKSSVKISTIANNDTKKMSVSDQKKPLIATQPRLENVPRSSLASDKKPSDHFVNSLQKPTSYSGNATSESTRNRPNNSVSKKMSAPLMKKTLSLYKTLRRR